MIKQLISLFNRAKPQDGWVIKIDGKVMGEAPTRDEALEQAIDYSWKCMVLGAGCGDITVHAKSNKNARA